MKPAAHGRTVEALGVSVQHNLDLGTCVLYLITGLSEHKRWTMPRFSAAVVSFALFCLQEAHRNLEPFLSKLVPSLMLP